MDKLSFTGLGDKFNREDCQLNLELIDLASVPQIGRSTQNCIVALFQQKLKYRYLGNLEKEEENSNVDEVLLSSYLTKKGYSSSLISKAIFEFKKIVTINTNKPY